MTQAAASAEKPPRLKLTAIERKASIMLALLFASRMLGLFLLTPVFAVAAQAIPGGNDATRVGLALGAYGLTQAVMRIPLGMASDKYGRRAVIVLGRGLVVVGGVLCALATDAGCLIGGRTRPGVGAVAAASRAGARHGDGGGIHRPVLCSVAGALAAVGRQLRAIGPVLGHQFAWVYLPADCGLRRTGGTPTERRHHSGSRPRRAWSRRFAAS